MWDRCLQDGVNHSDGHSIPLYSHVAFRDKVGPIGSCNSNANLGNKGTGDCVPAPSLERALQLTIVRNARFSAFDAQWQHPAITEQHAWRHIAKRVTALAASDWHYVAFPWATLIDKLHRRTLDSSDLLAQYRAFSADLPPKTRRVTVCQHIKAREFSWLFAEANISHVFWSHATRRDQERPRTPEFRPFPLFPVQVTHALPEAALEYDTTSRPYLYCFVGARADRYYPARTRNHILRNLVTDPRGFVVGRPIWHFQRVVYDFQVEGLASTGAALIDDGASDLFREVLRRSRFALCPSGTGPNSIRLWEALGSGTIPVILSDTWEPPGGRDLWDAAAVFAPETLDSVLTLPNQLAKLATDPERLASMRHAGRQLWARYGPEGFVGDVIDLMSH